MNDFTGREIQVGHILAVSPARNAYLYAATVIAIETYSRPTYNGQTRQVEDRSFVILTVRLHSNGRKQKLDEWDGYSHRVVITGEEAPAESTH